MLESELKKNTAAVIELTAALHAVRLPSTAAASAVTPQPGADAGPPAVPAAPAVPLTATEVAAPVPAGAADLVGEEETAAVPTKKQLVEKFIELAQSKDREVAVKLLADYGVSKLPELKDKTKWAPFIASVDALLAG